MLPVKAYTESKQHKRAEILTDAGGVHGLCWGGSAKRAWIKQSSLAVQLGQKSGIWDKVCNLLSPFTLHPALPTLESLG